MQARQNVAKPAFCDVAKIRRTITKQLGISATTNSGALLEKTILTVFQGRAGDHNNLAIPGAAAVATAISGRLDLPVEIIGSPESALNTDWRPEMDAATPVLQAMSRHYASIFASGMRPLTVLTRCAVALATLPIVAKNRPDACIVWLDAHADLNTPETSTSGYLGGMAISGAAGLWDSGLGGQLALSNVILVGARDIDPAERDLIDAAAIQVIPPHGDIVAKMVDAIASRPVYVHLDCDVLDAGVMPSDYQIEGGLTLTDLRRVAAALATCEIVGVEIAEFQSAWEKDGPPVSPTDLLNAIDPLIEYFGS